MQVSLWKLILYHLAIAENLIKKYTGEYVGESFNMELLLDAFSKSEL